MTHIFPSRPPQPLLRRPQPELCDALAKALAVTARAFAVTGAHRKDLAKNIRELSRLLTEERSGLHRPYWSDPGFFHAYLHYFLPWNLYRLAWLLPGLGLPLSDEARILDLGSGPLTLPLALWIARPELRDKQLTLVCTDTAKQPMQAGLSIFKAMAGNESPWRILLRREPLSVALNDADAYESYDLIMAGNVLNEPAASRRAEAPLAERIEEFVDSLSQALKPDGRCLLVEPGTRLGGKLVAMTRSSAIEAGLSIEAPCTHEKDCPLLEQPGKRSQLSSWCHVTFPSDAASGALKQISEAAGFTKTHLALSFVVAVKKEDTVEETATPGSGNSRPRPAAKILRARVLSGPIRLPDYEQPGRYICTEKGIALVVNAARMSSGAELELPWPERLNRDRKTGVPLVSLNESATHSTPSRLHPGNQTHDRGFRKQPEKGAVRNKNSRTKNSRKAPE